MDNPPASQGSMKRLSPLEVHKIAEANGLGWHRPRGEYEAINFCIQKNRSGNGQPRHVIIMFDDRYYKILIGHPTRFKIDSLIIQLKLGVDPVKARYPKK